MICVFAVEKAIFQMCIYRKTALFLEHQCQPPISIYYKQITINILLAPNWLTDVKVIDSTFV